MIGQTIDNRYRVEALLGRGDMAQIYLWQGNLTDAETAINRAETDPHRADIPTINFLAVLLADSELAFKKHDYARALAIMDELHTILRQYGARRYLPDGLYYLQGQALMALGQTETARDGCCGGFYSPSAGLKPTPPKPNVCISKPGRLWPLSPTIHPPTYGTRFSPCRKYGR